MLRLPAAMLAAIVSFQVPRPAAAEELVLDLDGALARARARSPDAAMKLGEARGRRIGAGALLRENPTIDTAVGPRRSPSPGGTGLDVEVGLEQGFELGGGRGARIAAADAGIEQATAEAEDDTRRHLREVAIVFHRALHAEEMLRLAGSGERLAAEIASVAERRQRAGDVAVLDVNLARVALARARADLRTAEAQRGAVLGELRTLLGMRPEDRVSVRGELRARRSPTPGSEDRADLRALAAGVRGAEAERRAAGALAWPEAALGVRYAREEGADIVLGTFSLTLPLFERGQGARAESAARARLLREQLDVRRRAVAVERQTAAEVHERRHAAIAELEGALPLLDENEMLARRSYETGQLGLVELLLIQREILDTRAHHLDRLLDAALAGVDLEASAGAMP